MTTASSVIGYFLGASAVLTISPGPDNLFIIAQGVSQGRRAAVITALGMCSGISVHTTAAALGISAVFYSSAVAFNLMKFVGAAYLLYLAVRTFLNRSPARAVLVEAQPAGALFRRGFLMNVLNPKVALFFLAFLPQFVTPPAVAWQMLGLGLLFMAQAVVIFGTLGYFAGSVGKWLVKSPRLERTFGLITGGVLASLGVRLALAQR